MSLSEHVNYYDDEAQAARYDLSENIRSDGERRVDGFNLDPSCSVLDIGSGPGTLAIPLAKKVKQVTAVEPSIAMIGHLKRHIEDENISNLNIFHSTWEAIRTEEVEAHDIVIASYSLAMQDIKAAIVKMNQIATRRVYLYWFAGLPTWERIKMDLYPKIFGREYIPGPKCDILYNVLYGMGLYPDVTVLEETSFPRIYSNMEDAIEGIRGMLNLSENEHDHIIRKYIIDQFEEIDGELILDDCTTFVQLSWKPTRSTVPNGK